VEVAPALLALGLCACAPTAVHHPEATPGSIEPAHRGEKMLTRRVVPAEGVELHATLWDASLVTGDDTARFADVYLRRTSFTVVAEVEDRWPELPAEALLRPEHWWFRLDRGGRRELAPQEVRLLVADRFPTAAGRHHHRLVFAVHFEGPLHPSLPAAGPSPLRLHVALRVPESGRRPMTGHVLRSRGATLRWRVEACGTGPHARTE
jgi:hypothetical protein